LYFNQFLNGALTFTIELFLIEFFKVKIIEITKYEEFKNIDIFFMWKGLYLFIISSVNQIIQVIIYIAIIFMFSRQ